MMDRPQQIEALRGAVRRATATFLERAPEGGHGEVVLDEESGQKLSYRRIDREYGIYVEGKGIPVPLDKAPTRWLIAGSKRIGDLFTAVAQSLASDAKEIKLGIDSALSFVEQFDAAERDAAIKTLLTDLRLARDGRLVEAPTLERPSAIGPWAPIRGALEGKGKQNTKKGG